MRPRSWLQMRAPEKTGPSGIGKQGYTWYQQNVHLVPFTWGEEVVLLHRELERAQASLLLEEHNNRNLPPLLPVAAVPLPVVVVVVVGPPPPEDGGGGKRTGRFRWIAANPWSCCFAIQLVTPAPQSPPCAT